MVNRIEYAWGWTGIKPEEIVGENDFGNLMVRDHDGKYWRICPEELSCKVVADNRAALDVLSNDAQFQRDWDMEALVELAVAQVGALSSGRKYCLKIPAILGGAYGGENLASIAWDELIELAGE